MKLSDHPASAPAPRTESSKLKLLLEFARAEDKTAVLTTLLLEELRKVVPFRGAALLVPEPDGKASVCIFTGESEVSQRMDEQPLATGLLRTLHALQDENPVGEEIPRPLLSELQRLSPAFASWRSWLVVPMVSAGEQVGWLLLAADRTGSLSRQHRDALADWLDMLAPALQRVRAEEQARRSVSEMRKRLAQQALENRQARSELEGFAYIISHELGAPLQTVLRLISVAEQAGAGDCAGELQKMARLTARMDALVQNLLAYSRFCRDSLELRPVHLGLVVSEARQQLAESIAGSGAEIEVPPALPRRVLAHHKSLVQVVAHLLENAMQFTDSKSKPRIKIRAEEMPEQVRLWIEDNGMGIAPEQHQRIFELFENAGSGSSGSGIGLAIVRKAVQRMSGAVGVESAPGRGSRFWILLQKQK